MALTQLYTAIPNDVITAARWNNEFGNIYNNGTLVAFPAQHDISLAGYSLETWNDGNQLSALYGQSGYGFVLTSAGTIGTPSKLNGNAALFASMTFTDNITAGSGVATSFSGFSFGHPTVAASNTLVTTTDAATVYIDSGPVAGTNETLTNSYALWIDAGTARLDGNVIVGGTLDVAGAVTGITFDDNPIINGAMDIWQRGTTFAAIVNNAYTADRFKIEYTSSSGVMTVNRSTSVPTLGGTVPLFNYSLEVDITTADASVAAGEYAFINQVIEGFNWRHFAQRAFTLSFWVLSTKTGTHCVSFRNTGNDRSYVATYTVNATNTWEYKSVNVSASPSAGTWDYTTGFGLGIGFCFQCGSTFQTTAGTWQTGNFLGTSAQENVLDNSANFFRITGVKMELGSVATPFVYRAFGNEIDLCKRYYQKSFPYATAPAQNAGTTGSISIRSQMTSASAMWLKMDLSTPMRIAPTVTSYNTSASNAEVRNTTDGVDDSSSSAGSSENIMAMAFTANAANTIGDFHQVHVAGTSEL